MKRSYVLQMYSKTNNETNYTKTNKELISKYRNKTAQILQGTSSTYKNDLKFVH